MVFVCHTEMSKHHLLRQFLHTGIAYHHKLLVGWLVKIELVTLLLEDLFHLHGHVYGVA